MANGSIINRGSIPALLKGKKKKKKKGQESK